MNDLDIFRKEIIQLGLSTGYNHLAPALSCAEIIYIIYNTMMEPEDKFILSKGHACLALYSILKKKGLNPSMTYGHPDIDKSNGIECTTGSLGHGLPIGIGIAFAKKFKKESGKIYVLVSDGEMQEGTTWESLLLGAHHKLDNLVVIVDNNRLQAIDFVENVISLGDLKRKFEAFDWNVYEVDGHDCLHLSVTLMKIPKNSRPSIIIADTIKGKGLSCAENKSDWHAKLPTKEELDEKYLC